MNELTAKGHVFQVKRFLKRLDSNNIDEVSRETLREWFCSEMVSKGISDSYVVAFCGRIPRSILAKHCPDYSPEKLKAIYEKARLRVLS